MDIITIGDLEKVARKEKEAEERQEEQNPIWLGTKVKCDWCDCVFILKLGDETSFEKTDCHKSPYSSYCDRYDIACPHCQKQVDISKQINNGLSYNDTQLKFWLWSLLIIGVLYGIYLGLNQVAKLLFNMLLKFQ